MVLVASTFLISNDQGEFIRTWNHWTKIDRSVDGKALSTDRIEIEAGMMTLPV
jgi:hypothetical protein